MRQAPQHDDDTNDDAAYPGAVVVANLLRGVAVIAVGVMTVIGAIIGSTVSSDLRVVGAIFGGLVGVAAGGLVATSSYALAYILLLLTEIEVNTHIAVDDDAP